MIAACSEHLERAIDEFVVAQEQAPDILTVDQARKEAWPIPATCSFCGREPRYVVAKLVLPA